MQEPTPTSEPRRPVRVYLLDDHELVRYGIRNVLERDGDIVVVGESGRAQQAANLIPALRPDVALLDVRLPDGSGIDVCRQIRSVDPRIAAIMLTSYEEDEALFAAITAGAAGYILKQIKAIDLADTVRRVAAGQSLIDPALTARVLTRLRGGPPVDPLTRHLTPKEREVLTLVGQGMTNRQIATSLHLSEKTTKNYVSTMLGKLGVRSRTQAAIIAIASQHKSP